MRALVETQLNQRPGIAATIFDFLQRGVLDNDTAVAYLSNPLVTGLTTIQMAALDSIPTARQLATEILIPAAREATKSQTIDLFAGRTGGLIERWQRHHQPTGNELNIAGTLSTIGLSPAEEDYCTTALAYTATIHQLVDHLHTITHNDKSDIEIWKGKFLRPTQRYAEAIRKKIAHAATQNDQDTLREAYTLLVDEPNVASILRALSISSGNEFISIRNNLAITALTVTPPGGEVIKKVNKEQFDSNILFWALDSRPHQETAQRAATELVKRVNNGDEEAQKALTANIRLLSFVAWTGNIWRNLTQNIVGQIKDRQVARSYVAELANRICAQDQLDLDVYYEDIAMMELVFGLDGLLQLPKEKLKKIDVVEDGLIADPLAGDLLRKLLQLYLPIPGRVENQKTRAGLLNLAATLSLGYTSQIGTPAFRELVNEVANKLITETIKPYEADPGRFVRYNALVPGYGRYEEGEASIILLWRADKQKGLPAIHIHT